MKSLAKLRFFILLTATLLASCRNPKLFDEQVFLKNGPHQQGSVRLDRAKLQTVVTWCSPTLLQMRVYDNVTESYPLHYTQLKGEDHPLQVSVTVFPPKLPFDFALNYQTPVYAKSVCSPARIETTLADIASASPTLTYDLGKPFKVSSDKMSAVIADCDLRKAGYNTSDQFRGAAYGKTGGVALIPAGENSTVIAQCQDDGFSIQIN